MSVHTLQHLSVSLDMNSKTTVKREMPAASQFSCVTHPHPLGYRFPASYSPGSCVLMVNYRIWCFVEGLDGLDDITIPEDGLVADLRRAIYEQRRALSNLSDLSGLMLLKVCGCTLSPSP